MDIKKTMLSFTLCGLSLLILSSCGKTGRSAEEDVSASEQVATDASHEATSKESNEKVSFSRNSTMYEVTEQVKAFFASDWYGFKKNKAHSILLSDAAKKSMERDSTVGDPSTTQFERFNVMDTFKKDDSILMLVDTVVTNKAQTSGSGCVYRLLLTMEDDHLRLDQIIGESGEDAIDYRSNMTVEEMHKDIDLMAERLLSTVDSPDVKAAYQKDIDEAKKKCDPKSPMDFYYTMGMFGRSSIGIENRDMLTSIMQKHDVVDKQ